MKKIAVVGALFIFSITALAGTFEDMVSAVHENSAVKLIAVRVGSITLAGGTALSYLQLTGPFPKNIVGIANRVCDLNKEWKPVGTGTIFCIAK